MRFSRRKALAGLVGVIAPAPGRALARTAPPDGAPDATATFAADTVALGVGYSWGGGRLTFRDRNFNFTVTGLTLLGVGADRVEGRAEIYHLKTVKDFEGVYMLAAAVGVFVTLSGATAVLRNAKGVEIRLRAKGRGVSLAIAAGGAHIKLG
jgi:hypothetical protein